MLNISQLQVGQLYNFIPPEGEFPPAFGKCTLLYKNGNQVALRQEADAANPYQCLYNSKGENKPEPRRKGEASQRWVMFASFAEVTAATPDAPEVPKGKQEFKA